MNDLKDILVLTCNGLFLEDGSTILDDFSHEQLIKSVNFPDVENDLKFTPLFDKANMFDMSNQGDLLKLVEWLNAEYGSESLTFQVDKPTISLQQVTETEPSNIFAKRR